ncbi:alpha/beta hydrolase [Apiospora phragmitis]|uniref:Alpha/beta hydrolase n=1 Tax=Apiospora phragmitis TaxID=2905665 RepID=A0ABR1T2U6_9PEZI
MAVKRHGAAEVGACNPANAGHLDWVTGETSLEGLVRGSHGIELFLATSGPPRVPGQPVVIFEAGAGACSSSWGPVRRLLDPRIRSYGYDRAGYGRSPSAASLRTAGAMAGELLDVLSSAGVGPPYILVAHSFGALVAREVVALLGPDDVAGLVLADANQEKAYKAIEEPLQPLVSLAGPRGLALLDQSGMLAGGDLYTADELHRLTLDAEREAKVNTSATETALLEASSDSLARRGQFEAMALGMQPVTIIRGDTKRDYRRVIAATRRRSDLGTEARRVLERLHDFIENEIDARDNDLQREQMRLSANSRFVQALESGHAVIATEPQLVADEVSSVWESCLSGRF